MPAEVLQIVQAGVEASFGAGGPADKRLLSWRLGINPTIPVVADRGQGYKGPTGTVAGAKEMTAFPISGNSAFNDLLYLYSTYLCTPIITTPAGATNTRRWTFLPSNTEADTFKSLVIMIGVAANAKRVTGCRLNSFSQSFNPEASDAGAMVAMTGQIIGQEIQRGQTLTASPTTVPKVNLPGGKGTGVFMAESEEDLLDNRIRPLFASWAMENRHAPTFDLDEDEPSFADTVESEETLAPTAQLVMRDTASLAYLDYLRDAARRILLIRTLGPQIEEDFRYAHRVFMPVTFNSYGEEARQANHAVAMGLAGAQDDDFGGILRIEIDTPVTAL